MRKPILKTLALSAALLIGTASISSFALDVNVDGGGGGGATTIEAGPATVTIGGGGNDVGSANVNAGGQDVNANVGGGSGPLAVVDSKGNTTNADVNLGRLLGTLGGLGNVGGDPPGAGGDGPAPAKVDALLSGMSGGDQAALVNRCQAILVNPIAYDDELVRLCRMIRKL